MAYTQATAYGNEDMDPRGGPHYGPKTGFTAILKVKPGHEQALREAIEADRQNIDGVDAGIAQIGTLHEFRWVLFDDDRRLFFASSFDGDWETYIQDFAAGAVGQMLDKNLAHVEDWVGIHHPDAAEQLLRYGVPAVLYRGAYPATVQEVKKALAVQEAFEQVLDDPAAAEALQHPALKPLLEHAAN